MLIVTTRRGWKADMKAITTVFRESVSDGPENDN